MSTQSKSAESIAAANIESLSLLCADGRRLQARLFLPAGEPSRIVQINSALGVPQRYYAAFAAYLTQAGMAVLTFDYRGIGDSRDRDLSVDNVRFQDWAEHDMATALAYLRGRFAAQKLLVVGHSAGAAIFGLAANCVQADALLGIAAPSGYWRNYGQPQRAFIWAFWHLLIPVLARTHDYFPGQYFGMGPLPKQVVLQWRHWGMHPEYLVDERGLPLREYFQAFQKPIRLLHISDDKMYAPLAAVEQIASFYGSAHKQVETITPAQYAMTRIGHFGFFKRTMAVAAWHDARQWLLTVV